MDTHFVTIDREDIASLVREPSPAARARVAEKICHGFNAGQFSDSEIALATEIFRLLLRDTEIKVRRVLADLLKDNAAAPHDVILSLAQDVAEAAVPVLQHSLVLTEADLLAIIHASRELAKLEAIAARPIVQEAVTQALIDKHEAKIIARLLGNPHATLNEKSLEAVIEQYGQKSDILEALVYRGGLPYAFAERLFYRVSGSLKKQLVKKIRTPAAAIDAARETATLQFLCAWMSQQDLTHLVHHMEKAGRLTDSLLLRSLCIGDARFFETAISLRVGIPLSNVKILMADPGPLGFRTLYSNALLPEEFYESVRVLLKLAQEETHYGAFHTIDYCARMVERIVHGGYDKTVAHMETLLEMMGHSIRVQQPFYSAMH